MQQKIDLLSQLLRELESDVGTSELTKIVLKSLKDAVRSLKNEACNQMFYQEFKKLVEITKETKPKFGILNNYFELLLKETEKLRKEKKCGKENVLKKIDGLLEQAEIERTHMLENADNIKVEGKTILIHDHSHTVHDVLRRFKKQKKKFRVIIAEQDYRKTHENIEVLHKMKVPFQVVPAYMLSHIQENVDMVFFGGLTLKDTMHFVMDPGAYGVISQFHSMKVPVYMFMNTSKFSLWKSQPRGEIFFHEHKRQHHTKPIEYSRIKYSHDRVPTDLFHKVVTNEGMVSPEQLKKCFEKRLGEK